MTRTLLAVLIWLLVVALVGLGLWQLGQRQRIRTDERPLVVATVPHVASWLKNILEPDAQVEVLVRGGQDVHDFNFSPATLKLTAQARAVVANGAGLESWLPDLRQQIASVALIDTSKAVEVWADDPHIWLDPVRAQAQVQYASQELQKVFPELASRISARTAEYLAKLEQLDADFRTSLLTLPRQNFVAFHASFNYLAARYGLKQTIHLVERPGATITFGDIEELGEQLSEGGFETIFVEPGPLPDVAQTLADEFGLTTRVLDTLETASPEADSYVRLMRQNMAELVAGL